MEKLCIVNTNGVVHKKMRLGYSSNRSRSITIANSVVHSKFDYFHVLYCNCIIVQYYIVTYNSRLQILDLHSLECRRVFFALLVCYKITDELEWHSHIHGVHIYWLNLLFWISWREWRHSCRDVNVGLFQLQHRKGTIITFNKEVIYLGWLKM